MTLRALLLLMLALQGCHNPREIPDDGSADWSWRATLPVEDSDLIDESFEINSFWEVAASELEEALHALENQAIVDVSDYDWGTRQFGVRVADMPPVGPTTRRFLVRALYIQAATGGFGVYYDGKRLWVSHSCLGKSPVAPKKTALIVVLRSVPDAVYVDASMDE
jgi:hypothetical protein